MTLLELRRIRPFLNIRSVAQEIGMKPVTLYRRLELGRPEFTAAQSKELDLLIRSLANQSAEPTTP